MRAHAANEVHNTSTGLPYSPSPPAAFPASVVFFSPVALCTDSTRALPNYLLVTTVMEFLFYDDPAKIAILYRSCKHFLLFVERAFGRFCVSLTSDGRKLSDSAFRSRATGRNWVILRFAYERRAVFSVFLPVGVPRNAVVG